MTDPAAEGYIGGLPEASGTFTGTYASDLPAEELFPLEVDTHDQPNSLADAQAGESVIVTFGDRTWVMPIDRIEPLGGGRVRAWLRRPGQGDAHG